MGIHRLKREKFCQLLATGNSPIYEAYALAGYKPNGGNASVMSLRPDVLARVNEIKAERFEQDRAMTLKATRKAGLTRESMLEMADEIRREAKENRQYAAAAAALKEMGVLAGLRIERSERGSPHEFAELSDAALLDELRSMGVRIEMDDGKTIEHEPS
jgi:hypothetical protein